MDLDLDWVEWALVDLLRILGLLVYIGSKYNSFRNDLTKLSFGLYLEKTRTNFAKLFLGSFCEIILVLVLDLVFWTKA